MKPSERINRNYELKQSTAEIVLDGRLVQVPITVVLELSPRPQTILKCEFSWSDAAATNEINSKGEVSVRLNDGREIDTVVGDRWELGGGKIRNILIPKSQPVTVRDNNTLLARCKFALVNFPNMWGDGDIVRFPDPTKTASSLVYARFQLEANPWFINIIAVDSLMGVHYSLTRRGGSAITHVGTITRADAQEFSLSDLEKLLEALHLFLSFVRGSYCGLTLLSGYDSDRNRTWEQWGTYEVEPWRRELQTWADIGSSHTLSPVFEGLWKVLNDLSQSNIISQVIHWYLRSNESLEPQTGIVLNQAALERLSSHTVGSRGGKKEGDWIAEALKRMGINPSLPTHCHTLIQLQKLHHWSHGPHAIVGIRNDLIHADSNYGPLSKGALIEAQSLGLHYIELMLLWLSGYTGRYANRLNNMENHRSQVEGVPWAPIKMP